MGLDDTIPEEEEKRKNYIKHKVEITAEEHLDIVKNRAIVIPPEKKIQYEIKLKFEDKEHLIEHAESLEEIANDLREEYEIATGDKN
jgi:hypothetical protein